MQCKKCSNRIVVSNGCKRAIANLECKFEPLFVAPKKEEKEKLKQAKGA